MAKLSPIHILNNLENLCPPTLLGVFFALTSAAVWGSGDFCGGQAARKSHQYQVLMLAALSGMVVLVVSAIIRGEGLPTGRSFLWGAMAGSAGALGMAALYRALSMGHTASVAPTSAITCAALPVIFGMLTAGLPKVTQLVGFVVAFLGIWLLSRSPTAGDKTFREGMILAFLSGIGFGGFFIFIALVEKGQVFRARVGRPDGNAGNRIDHATGEPPAACQDSHPTRWRF